MIIRNSMAAVRIEVVVNGQKAVERVHERHDALLFHGDTELSQAPYILRTIQKEV